MRFSTPKRETLSADPEAVSDELKVYEDIDYWALGVGEVRLVKDRHLQRELAMASLT